MRRQVPTLNNETDTLKSVCVYVGKANSEVLGKYQWRRVFGVEGPFVYIGLTGGYLKEMFRNVGHYPKNPYKRMETRLYRFLNDISID